jgi:phosphate/sulfate permease
LFELGLGLSLLLVLCIFCVCVFEFINGFHDTANAVATVIYTNSLQPKNAVILSGILNGIGVFLGGTAVAMGIINMLPVETLVDQNLAHSLGMVGAILLTAIFWNLGTWWLAIPASSSHTLVGAILGVGIAYGLLPGTGDAAVNWHKAGDVGLSLLCSPLFGFLLALTLMASMARVFARKVELFTSPEGNAPPPWWIRTILIFTCGLVSFSHGSNDGQKGIGLMMLILIGIVPASFALDGRYDNRDIAEALTQIRANFDAVQNVAIENGLEESLQTAAIPLAELTRLTGQSSASHSSQENKPVVESTERDKQRFEIRKNILLLRNGAKILAEHSTEAALPAVQEFLNSTNTLRKFTDYAPIWVVVLIAFSLALGTMIGWERIVVTIGEKIGKTHLTYAQGASAEIVAASTIAASTYLGLPVSTTHVLSSGIAGSMFASGGVSNLDKGTIQKILLAWVLTLPVCIMMSATLFLIFRSITS